MLLLVDLIYLILLTQKCFDKLSQILSIPYDNVCEVTSENAINLFDLHK